jgi:L-rhamnonate dehydratase
MGALIAERHLARFVEGRPLDIAAIADTWERMFRGTLHFGRRGVVLHAISAVDIALWDALGKVRDEPLWHMLGPRRHERLPCYATTPRPDLAKKAGFVGGKMALPAGPAEGAAGMAENLALATEMRARCGDHDDFFLAFDCYMALDVPFSIELARRLKPLEYLWIEEFLPPDDYWGYREVTAAVDILTATGEHEQTRWGFRQLFEHQACDIVQPDLNWCGGLSELLHIAQLAREHGVRVVPHAGGPVAAHYLSTRDEDPLIEVVIEDADDPAHAPPFPPIFLGEPYPIDGWLTLPERPGVGNELNRAIPLVRPFPH